MSKPAMIERREAMETKQIERPECVNIIISQAQRQLDKYHEVLRVGERYVWEKRLRIQLVASLMTVQEVLKYAPCNADVVDIRTLADNLVGAITNASRIEGEYEHATT